MRRAGMFSSESGRIDIHQHVVPEFYRSTLESLGVTTGFGVPFPRWKVEDHIRVLDRFGIATSIVSISTPGVYFIDDSFSRKFCRQCNEFIANLVVDHPSRFGGFASLPLPDVDGALLELEYALDSLKMDGVVLLTNVRGHYLAEPGYKEIFQELDRREIILYIHPHDLPDKDLPSFLGNTLSPVLETTRCGAGLLHSGVLEKYSKIRIILSHAGGIVPFLADRISMGRRSGAISESFDIGMPYQENRCQKYQKGIRLLGRLYFDTITSSGNHAFRSMQALVDTSHILLGTDYIWFPEKLLSTRLVGYRRYPGFNKKAIDDIERNNALGLFPRLRSS